MLEVGNSRFWWLVRHSSSLCRWQYIAAQIVGHSISCHRQWQLSPPRACEVTRVQMVPSHRPQHRHEHRHTHTHIGTPGVHGPTQTSTREQEPTTHNEQDATHDSQDARHALQHTTKMYRSGVPRWSVLRHLRHPMPMISSAGR